MKNGVINIHGKEYQTVALRVSNFREKHPDYSLVTEIISRDGDEVVMVAKISDATGRILATGHAEENRAHSQINRTSALENCETSAIGRALAALGIGGTEFASANEVQNAIHQQNNVTPNAGAGDDLSQQQRNHFADVAVALCEAWRLDDKESAYKLYLEAKEVSEKNYLWAMIGQEKHNGTLIRSQLKAYAASKKEAA